MHYSFSGQLTARDCKHHLTHTFVAPPNSNRIEIRLEFAPYYVGSNHNLLTLTLFDPDGFRGAGHRSGNTHTVVLTPESATPGYFAGPLSPGRWSAQLDAHMIMPGAPVVYHLEVTITEMPTLETLPPTTSLRSIPRGVLKSSPGWYRGDLHSHTTHSDGHHSVAELLQAARAAGLDFVFLTDHNTIAGLPEMDAETDAELLTCGGMELTTYWGHALYLGAREWVDWRMRPGSGAITLLADAAYATGGAFVIAHPQSIGDPDCTGCAWRFGEMMPGVARLVEVWNGPWAGDSRNEASLALWYDWLNQGIRIAATAGSDAHRPGDYAAGPGFNVIYADELSEAALLQALVAGRLYLSAGPRLTLEAGPWRIGDTATAPATFTATWDASPPDARLRVLANGRLLQQWPVGASGARSWEMRPEQADWVTLELRAANGEMLALTNPIFLQRPSVPT